MAILDDVVRETIEEFIANGELFTALDVSNKVKARMPFARHREVRDLVRASFLSEIEPAGYAKTIIRVNLADGSSAEALLYHALSDSWDLDAKYDAQKRAQSSAKPTATPVVSSVSDPVIPVTPAPVATPAADLSARAAWQNLFANQPSLFPRK